MNRPRLTVGFNMTGFQPSTSGLQPLFKSESQSADDPLQFVLSDDSTDRMGDTIQPSGWDLRAFEANPIALWQHASSRPIGRWIDVRVSGNKLLGKLVFADPGTSVMIDELRALVEQNVIKAVSVGFNPIEFEPIRGPKGGTNFKRQELLEVSLVSVPANKNAVAVARSMGISEATISEVFDFAPKGMRISQPCTGIINFPRITINRSHGASAIKAREALAKAQQALSGVRK